MMNSKKLLCTLIIASLIVVGIFTCVYIVGEKTRPPEMVNQPGFQPEYPESDEFVWENLQRKAWVSRQNDPGTWNMDRFREDMEAARENNWPTKPAISSMPAPHSDYSNWGGAMFGVPLEIENKAIHSTLFMWSNYPENGHMFEDPKHQRATYLNLHILADNADKKWKANHYSSRNYPHVLITGKHKTSVGDVDFIAMGLATGDSWAIINQRIFDLNFGRTILVAPQKDGSIRFMQLADTPRSFMSADTRDVFRKYNARLQANKEVVEFFTNDQTIESQTK